MGNWVYFLDKNDVLHINTYKHIIYENVEQKEYDIFNIVYPLDELIYEYDTDEFNKLNNLKVNDLTVFNEKIVYLYFEIIVKENQKIVFDLDFPGTTKMWINEKIFIISEKRDERSQLLYASKKEKLKCLIEFRHNNKTWFLPYLLIQVYKYNDVEKNLVLPKSKKMIEDSIIKIISKFEKDYNKLYFMINPLTDSSNLFHVTLKDKITQKNREIDLIPYLKYCLDLTEYDFEDFNLSINIDEKEYLLYSYISENKIRQIQKSINQKISNEVIGLTEKVHSNLLFEYEKSYLYREIQRMLHSEYSNQNVQNFETTETIYYFSEIEHKVRCFEVLYPCILTDKPLPALICLAVHDFDSINRNEIKNNDYFVFNFPSGGIVGSGYIGYPIYKEMLNIILSRFRINSNYIYLTGKSNGGYAVWDWIENQPDLFAGAYPISGYPYIKNINNIINLPIINCVSNLDNCYEGRTMEILDNLCKSNLYTQKNLPDLAHHIVSNFKFHSLSDFVHLNYERNSFPRKIYFRSEKSRFLSAYWIKLIGISFGKVSAFVQAEILNNFHIKIIAENTNGLEIKLPPYINRNHFIIEINGYKFQFNHYVKNVISFSLRNKRYFISKSDNLCNFDNCKGTGLLDVYLDKLSVVSDNLEDNLIFNLAKNFASPKTNGFISDIEINFPITKINKNCLYLKQNFIFVLDQLSSLNLMNLDLIVNLSASSCSYKNKDFSGKYLVMQVIENPYSKNNSILLIYSNDKKLYKRNILLRKISLPYFSYGQHEFWNNEALIYFNSQFYAIYERGSDLIML